MCRKQLRNQPMCVSLLQHPPPKYKSVDGGAIEVEADPKDVKFFTRDGQRAFIHPGSALFRYVQT